MNLEEEDDFEDTDNISWVVWLIVAIFTALLLTLLATYWFQLMNSSEVY